MTTGFIRAVMWKNFSTVIVENLVEMVEKPIVKQIFNTFHRVFNQVENPVGSTLCINSDVSTRRKNDLHFWCISGGKVVKSARRGANGAKKDDKAPLSVLYCYLIIEHSR